MLKGTIALPIVGTKKKIHVPKKMAIVMGGFTVLSVLALVYMYFKYPPFRQSIHKLIAGPPKTVDVADQVLFDVVPDVVRPNSYFNITGKFLDKDNQEVLVKEGFFYVMRTDSLANPSGQQVVMQGSLGQNLSTFNKTAMTPGFTDGEYRVIVTDQPLPASEIGNLHSGTGPFGSKKGSMSNPSATPGVNEIPNVAGG